MKDLIRMEEEFKRFLEDCAAGKYASPLDIPIEVWGMHGWEQLSRKKLEELLLPFIKFNLERAKKYMPVYESSYKDLNVKSIETMEDFWRIPALVKDSAVHGVGFREKVRANPYTMLPRDVKSPIFVFKSGGTKGVPTPTFITAKDREIESTAFARGYRYEGMKDGDIALSTYNPTHKGGEEIKEAFIKNGMTYIPRRTTDSAIDIINTILHYNVNVILTVQGPVSKGDAQSKGGGVDLMNLISAGEETLKERIRILFLGGYRLVDEAVEWVKANDKTLVTLLGSSEAIPQATNTGFGPKSRLCQFNNLHLLQGPHYMEILKEESGILVPVKKGETGILAYTTVAREGTIYIRYFPGDKATVLADYGECNCGIKSPVITDVERIDIPEEVVETGCCIG